MKLPELPITLAIIAILWAVAGVWAHGWVMLAYPMMWALVGLFFFGLNAAYNAMHPTDETHSSDRIANESYGHAAGQGSRQHVA